MNIGATIKLITSIFFLLNDIKKGNSNPGTIIEPNVYHIRTTEGMLIANISDIKPVTKRPFFINGIESSSFNI